MTGIMNPAKILLLTISCLITVSGGFSQAPDLLNYQAVSRNPDGSPVTERTIGIRITIKESSASGLVLFRETHEVETNQFGLFSLFIGSGESNQDFGGINWNSGHGKWLQVEMDIENSGQFSLMGSSQLLSVPYALFARQAGSASMVLSLLTDSDRAALENPVDGTMIFNTTTNSINVYRNGNWYEAPLTLITPEWQCGSRFTDPRDGQSYGTVKIGNQCWMAKNLNVGLMVNFSAGQSNNGIIEKYCYNNLSQNGDFYGGLYTWDEMMNYTKIKGAQGICPDGWHIPTDQEWQEMEMALGMSSSEASKSNTWRGTDQGTQLGPEGSSGYQALYSGRSVPGFGFTALESYEYIWTSDEAGDNAWRRCLDIASPKVGRYDSFPKTYGMSIRCVR